ncbi:DNA gyrase inhibitor YacG [Chelatococcus sp. SYSU_G07232]|uniref:DNA gyrase inhibitor YacG n=1 Tax=Chelatococcus albus TaxID=3047466 RepID=A0ABT7AKI4_9HYPH|nr:DNA gyrase inhibitor YacG [Chelatococcus sp. SYSU_G07232]MDJ1159874.1 DNA gyrase inhibitor YacG [Chelatococcus sp. SYSU_G07232]
MTQEDKPDATPRKPQAARPCPICGKPAEQRWKPFCSKRCADVDLNRWLSGAYAIPVVEDEEGPEEPGAGQA